MKVSTENDNKFRYEKITNLVDNMPLSILLPCGSWAKEKVSTRGRKRTLTDSERKMNRSEVSSKWNKCRIYVGDQLDRWDGTIIPIMIVLGLFCQKIVSFAA
jgi:hypothetical protein